jgi:hypothetical protein
MSSLLWHYYFQQKCKGRHTGLRLRDGLREYGQPVSALLGWNKRVQDSMFGYELNLIFLVVTSAIIGTPSWILSFSISPCPSSLQ